MKPIRGLRVPREYGRVRELPVSPHRVIRSARMEPILAYAVTSTHGGFPTPKQDECIGDAVHFQPHMQIQTKASYPSLFSTIFLIRHVHLWFHQAEGQANEIILTMMTGRLSIPASRLIENDNTLESVVSL
jgi:hypothetical protein